MLVSNLCSHRPVTVAVGAPISDVALLMRDRHVGAVIVTEGGPERFRAIGMITDRDIIRAQFERTADMSRLSAGQVMTRNPLVIGEEELKKIAPGTAQEMKILQFVRSDEIDPIYLEKSYYVAPGKAGTRPYELLRRVMEQTGYDAVAKIAMHGREHIVVLRPRQDGLLLHTMYFSDELPQANQREREAPEDFSKKELELANTLIDGLKSEFKPKEYQDEFRHNVERLIDQKQKGRKVTSIRQPKPAVVTDLMSALEASLRQVSGSGAGSKGEADRKRAKKRAGKAA